MSTYRFLILISLTLASIAAASSTQATTMIAGILHSQSYQEEIKSQIEFGKQLDVIDGELRRQIHIKDSLVLELVAARTTLAKVSAEFLLINQSQPGSLERLRTEYAGDTDEERTARNVMGFVSAELAKESPLRRAAVMARLQVELEEMCAKSSVNPSPAH